MIVVRGQLSLCIDKYFDEDSIKIGREPTPFEWNGLRVFSPLESAVNRATRCDLRPISTRIRTRYSGQLTVCGIFFGAY